MPRIPRARALLTTVAAGAVAAAVVGAPVVGTPAQAAAPAVPAVLVSTVTIDAPLPASFGAHPAACDKLSYVRYRSAAGPAASAQADRILLTQPGSLAGAGSLDGIARHTVEDAAAAGKHLEFWAIDRRANCLEDNSGLTAAVAAGKPSIALDYYTRGTTVNGKKFAGYVPDKQLGWLKNMGIQQSVKDQYTLLTHELPDPAVRKSKVWCGGHSLGGVVTAFFTMADFDGNPATLGDAGYNQCAGTFALDSQVSTTIAGGSPPEPSGMDGIVSLGHDAVNAALDSGLLPRSLNIPVINPETINLLALAGTYAKLDPNGVSPLPSTFASNDNVKLALKFLLSKDAGMFITGSPDVTKVRITNEAALGALMDDNSSPIAIIQASLGFFGGTGRIVDKDFPAPNDLIDIPELKGITGFATGVKKKGIPDDVGPIWNQGSGPLYTWQDYREVAADGSNVAKDKTGKPFTTAASEITDIADLATDLSSGLDFTEHYFPLAMMTDTGLWAAGDRSAVPNAVHLDGPTKNPTINLLGGEGVVVSMSKTVPPNSVVLPGYQHLDVLTAARTQNTGKPEAGAAALSAFVLSH